MARVETEKPDWYICEVCGAEYYYEGFGDDDPCRCGRDTDLEYSASLELDQLRLEWLDRVEHFVGAHDKLVVNLAFIPPRPEDWSELHHAIVARDIEKATRLIRSGVDVDALTKYHETPLMFTAWCGGTEIAAQLLNAGAETESLVKRYVHPCMRLGRIVWGQTAMHWASFNDSLGVSELLLNQGANINAMDENEQTPLHLAAHGNSPNVARFLLVKGAKHWALDRAGSTPALIALNHYCAGLLKPFLEADDGRLAETAMRGTGDFFNPLRPLLDAGLDPNYADDDGFSLLMAAVRLKRPYAVSTLLERGASVSYAMKDGTTAMGIAKKLDDEEMSRQIARLLRKHGAK